MAIPRIAFMSQTDLGELITFIFLLWPAFMYLCHRGFSGLSIELGISLGKGPRFESRTLKVLYIIGWIASLIGYIFYIHISINSIDTVIRTPLFFFSFGGLLLISSRLMTHGSKNATIRRDKPTVLILDLDGVIRHIDIETAEKAAQSIGFSYDELMETLWYNEYSHELLCGRYDRETWWDHVSLFDERLEGVSQDVLWEEVFEKSIYDSDLVQYVRGLKDDLTLVILTNCDKESKAQILEELGDDHPFDHVISSSDLGIAKPNPDVYRTVLEEIGVKPGQTMYFDDSVANVSGAKELGIQAYLFRGLPEFIVRIRDAQNAS
jgi:putative hydrolase of the HAD superfamily